MSVCVFASVVIVVKSFPCLIFCVLVQPSGCGGTTVVLFRQPFSHLSPNGLGFVLIREILCCHRTLKKLLLFQFLLKSHTGLGLFNCFYCNVSRGLFLCTLCEKVFISLDYYEF